MTRVAAGRAKHVYNMRGNARRPRTNTCAKRSNYHILKSLRARGAPARPWRLRCSCVCLSVSVSMEMSACEIEQHIHMVNIHIRIGSSSFGPRACAQISARTLRVEDVEKPRRQHYDQFDVHININ